MKTDFEICVENVMLDNWFDPNNPEDIKIYWKERLDDLTLHKR